MTYQEATIEHQAALSVFEQALATYRAAERALKASKSLSNREAYLDAAADLEIKSEKARDLQVLCETLYGRELRQSRVDERQAKASVQSDMFA